MALALGGSFAPQAGAVTFIDWSSISAGSSGGIDVTIASTVNAGDLSVQVATVDDPTFVAGFASMFPELRYGAPAQNAPGDIITSYSFSMALPSGAMLLVADVDFQQETVTLSGDGAPLVLLDQVESTAGATSSFPTYDSVLGVLASTISNNLFEVSLFDLSGLTSLQLDYAGGGINSAVHVAIALPDDPGTGEVPAPAAGLLFALAAGGTLLAIRRRRADAAGQQ